jgi:hypothetical protein
MSKMLKHIFLEKQFFFDIGNPTTFPTAIFPNPTSISTEKPKSLPPFIPSSLPTSNPTFAFNYSIISLGLTADTNGN